jgi:formylglycine-generating enzyme required for sulfatase activity
MAADTEQAREAEPKARIFISYSRKDMAFADRLDAALIARGFEPLIDREEIYAFEDWWERIQKLIGQADTVVFVLSPDAVASNVALREITYAALLKKRFAPVIYRRVEDGAVPEVLRRLNFIFFDDLASFEARADKLAEALQTDIGWIRQHTEYGEAARRWLAAGRPGGLLLHSPTLEVAEHWITTRPRGAPEPTEEIRGFIAVSRKAEVDAKRGRRLLQIATYASLVAVIIGLVGWIKQDDIADQWHWWTVTRPYMAMQVRPYVLDAAKEQALKPGNSFKECAHDCPEMIVVPAGSFMMGSPRTEKGRYDNEGPQHPVTIAKPFAVGKFDVTFDEWDACVRIGGCKPGSKLKDGGWGRGRRPVINVSWDDATDYVTWLSKMTSKKYRLLSEAEWEYAARAQTKITDPSTSFSFGDDERELGLYAWYSANSYGKTWPVGQKLGNAFNLFDMHGNVLQWVEDCYHENYEGSPPNDGSPWKGDNVDCTFRVYRGGAYNLDPLWLRSAYRDRAGSSYTTPRAGFRVARTLGP